MKAARKFEVSHAISANGKLPPQLIVFKELIRELGPRVETD